MTVYVRKAVRVEAFQFGVQPQPQWFTDMTNTGLAIESMASFRCKKDARLLKMMHGDYVIRRDDLLWVCEGDKFSELYQLPDFEDESLPRDDSHVFLLLVGGAVTSVVGGVLFGMVWGFLIVGLGLLASGIYQWRNSQKSKKVVDDISNVPDGA